MNWEILTRHSCQLITVAWTLNPKRPSPSLALVVRLTWHCFTGTLWYDTLFYVPGVLPQLVSLHPDYIRILLKKVWLWVSSVKWQGIRSGPQKPGCRTVLRNLITIFSLSALLNRCMQWFHSFYWLSLYMSFFDRRQLNDQDRRYPLFETWLFRTQSSSMFDIHLTPSICTVTVHISWMMGLLSIESPPYHYPLIKENRKKG